MTSEIRVNKIENRSGLGTVTFADTGVDLAGIVTATTFSGSGASLTNLPAGNLSGTLPAISAANLTNVPAANITGTLPALSAASLTNIPAANLVGVCTSGLTRTGGFGKFVSYAIIGDVKANDVDGGTFTSGDWRTRDLNTELIDADDIVSISSNQFTLQAGTYFIEAQAMAYRVNRHMVKLYQTSGTPADIAFGTSMYANSAYNGNNVSVVRARVTISTATTYEIRHRGDTNHSTYGFGLGANFGTTELFTVVQIFKEE